MTGVVGAVSAASILPAEVVVVEVRDDPPEAELLPTERMLVVGVVDKRRREFTTGRHCARMALARLGIPEVAILSGDGGEPLWPEGVVGSITHCAGYRGAAVARRSSAVMAVGLDAEPHEPLPTGIADAVVVADERASLRALAVAHPEICWDRLLFSAKESVYKVWYPQAGRMLDFSDASITLAPDGTFDARIHAPDAGPLEHLTGRWIADDSVLLTAITVPGP